MSLGKPTELKPSRSSKLGKIKSKKVFAFVSVGRKCLTDLNEKPPLDN